MTTVGGGKQFILTMRIEKGLTEVANLSWALDGIKPFGNPSRSYNTASSSWPYNFVSLLFFLFQIQHFISDFVSFMPGVIRVKEAFVKLDLQVPSLIPLRQHFTASSSCYAWSLTHPIPVHFRGLGSKSRLHGQGRISTVSQCTHCHTIKC